MKKILELSAIVALIVFSVSVAKFSFFTDEKYEGERFVVSGEGSVMAAPDVATFTFGISDEGDDVDSLSADVEKKSESLIDFLVSKGIEKSDVKTTNYNVNPRYQYFRCRDDGDCPQPKINGYRINKNYSVKVREISEAGSIFSGVLAAGANTTNNLQFLVDDKEKYIKEARKVAIANAKKKANEMSEETGIDLGDIVSVNENMLGGGRAPMMRVETMAMDSGFGGAGKANVEAGENEIRMSVSLSYEVE